MPATEQVNCGAPRSALSLPAQVTPPRGLWCVSDQRSMLLPSCGVRSDSTGEQSWGEQGTCCYLPVALYCVAFTRSLQLGKGQALGSPHHLCPSISLCRERLEQLLRTDLPQRCLVAPGDQRLSPSTSGVNTGEEKLGWLS
jgi:hypothetical protein